MKKLHLKNQKKKVVSVRARRYRNRRIGEFLKELRFTESRGTGIPTIVKALKDNGSGSAKFDTNEPHRTHFLIEIPIHPEFDDQADDQANKLTKEQIEVLKYFTVPIILAPNKIGVIF